MDLNISVTDQINISENVTIENFRISPSSERAIGKIGQEDQHPVGNLNYRGKVHVG